MKGTLDGGAAAQSSRAPIGHGIALTLIAVLLFACMDAANKMLVQTYPVLQILWIRFLPLAVILAWLVARQPGRGLITRHFWLQGLRSLLFVTEVAVFVTAIGVLPLADAHAILAVAPLMVTALSVPMLGEQVGTRRWTAVAVAFFGVLVIFRPGLGVFEPYALLPLAAAAMWALYLVLTRIVGRSDSPLTSLFYAVFLGAIGLTIVVPFVWRMPDLEGWLLLLLVSVLGAVGHYLLIRALQLAPAVILQPLTYMMVVFATITGYLVFGDIPGWPTILGAAIIVASGIYVVAREHRLARN
ncbi:MAG: DMT family transporter [Pseudomonadota bacterium]